MKVNSSNMGNMFWREEVDAWTLWGPARPLERKIHIVIVYCYVKP